MISDSNHFQNPNTNNADIFALISDFLTLHPRLDFANLNINTLLLPSSSETVLNEARLNDCILSQRKKENDLSAVFINQELN